MDNDLKALIDLAGKPLPQIAADLKRSGLFPNYSPEALRQAAELTKLVVLGLLMQPINDTEKNIQ
jgi:hypothetical protein